MTLTGDNFPLHIYLACIIASCGAYLLSAIIKSEGAARWARGFYIASTAAVGYACWYMLQQILSGQRYDIAYIHGYSAPTDPLIYKVSSLWAGQEGSMLLWALLTGLIGLALLRRSPVLMSYWCSISVFFGAILVAADPFKKLVASQLGTPPLGLNPLLKNPWMAIHPPVVFLGYAALMVPAAFAVHALVKGDGKEWVAQCMPWALFGWVSLTAGLVLGMIWSYEVLGWGGYWSWDPVENASLVPWLTGTALVHGLVLQRATGRMVHSNLILALSTFVLVVYATFLTRSGVLANLSVHSFESLGAHGVLTWGLIIFAVLGAGILAVRWRSVSLPGKPLAGKSKDFALILGATVLALFCATVLIGTSFPLIMPLLGLRQSSLQPRFYTVMAVPVAVLISVLIAFASLLGWGGKLEGGGGKGMTRLAWIFCAVVALSVILAFCRFVSPPAGVCTPDVILQILALIVLTAAITLAVSVIKCRGTSILRSGAYVAHVGIALVIIGVVFSCSTSPTTLSLLRNGPAKSAAGCDFWYTGTRTAGPDTDTVVLKARRGSSEFDVPLKTEYTSSGAVRTSFIRHSLLGDVYVSPQEDRGTVLTAMMVMGHGGWVSYPVPIPGAKSSVTLLGMQVESKSAKLRYASPGKPPVQITVAAGQPVSIDGYTLSYQKFVSNGSMNSPDFTAGVDLGVTGGALSERVIIDVSRKPLISLLWIGTVLLLVGGSIAAIRRRTGINMDKQDGQDGKMDN